MISHTEAQELHEMISTSLQQVKDGKPVEADALEVALSIVARIVSDRANDEALRKTFRITTWSPTD